MRKLYALFILTFCTLSATSQIYLDPDAPIRERVDDLLSQMTLEEKVGQMTQAERSSLVNSGYADIQQFFLGSVLSGGGSVPSPNTVQGWVEMYNAMQDKALATRLGIPIIYGVDAVHGHNNLVNAVIFPHNIGLGCTRNPELVKQCAEITAVEVRATGVDWTFSPCVAVPQNEFWGRTYEGFSESPYLTDSLGIAAVEGYQGDSLGDPNGILACAKHYLGDGGTENGIDQGNTILTEDELREIHLPPYVSAIDGGVGSVMISFSSWNGVKCHGHAYLINDVLKDELGFSGVVLSDWKGINQVNGDFKEAIKTSINAGVDMAMQPDDYISFIDLLKQLVNEGQVSMERIDDAVSRILEVKYQLGLFENPYADLSLADTVGCAAHRVVARQAVRESVVLLKNDNLLPLPANDVTILVAGAKGDDVGAMCGGWSISWQGGLGEITEGTTILEGMQQAIGNQNVVYTENINQIPDADYAVVVVGENPYAEGVGDLHGNVDGFGLSYEDRQMIQSVNNANIPMLVVLLSGRPLDIVDELDDSDAFMAAWLPGTEGGSGIADVVFGDYEPTGKLSNTWPESYYDVPINIIGNYPGHEALFTYGFGLTYSISGIAKEPLTSVLKVFPNPAHDLLHIRHNLSGKISVEVYDVLGNIVLTETCVVGRSIQLAVNHLHDGVYILRLNSRDTTRMTRFVKE